ncbi:hypothetical protein HID58_007354 [Brassica napus]|uniref:Uncharacterized protein n=1 Tax=Brassica napus TaxID=3708 RepID=A0ABQ8EGK7_BRANA|nr:hypothetical protein HID58_007354 [Brassica napus]
MVKALQTRLPPISRKKKRRGDIRAYISRGDTSSSNIEEEEEERRHSSIHFSW